MTSWTPLSLSDFPFPAPRQVTGSRLGGAAKTGNLDAQRRARRQLGKYARALRRRRIELGGVYSPGDAIAQVMKALK